MSGGWGQGSFSIEGQPLADPHHPPMADYFTASPDYFKVMRIPLLAGRLFTERDNPQSPAVVIIDDYLARTFFPNRSPIGQRLGQPRNGEPSWAWWDTFRAWDSNRRLAPKSILRSASLQADIRRWSCSPLGHRAELTHSVRQIMGSMDADIPVTDLLPMEQRIARSLIAPRFRTILLGLFAALALLLAAVGIYGVVSYSVAGRTREIGIRLALGAQPRRVMRQVILEGMRLAALGEVAGVAGSLGMARLLSSLLFHVTSTDLRALLAVAAVLAAVALLACYLPARRATQVDPMVALRYE